LKNILIFACAFLLIGEIAEAKGWNIFSPKTDAEEVHITVSGKKKTYYRLSPGNPLTIEVTGPKQLRVLSRLSEADVSSKNDEYTVHLLRDGDKTLDKTFSTSVSKEAHLSRKKSARVGIGRNWTLRVPSGKHTYTFSVDEGNTVYVRFFTKPVKKKKKVSRVPLTPTTYDAVVPLHYREKELNYYRAAAGKPVTLEVYGPTKIKVLSRLEFEPRMKGDKTYRVQVVENGDVVRTVQVNATKSEVTKYANKTDKVPAKGESFFLEVPKGKHTYEFRVMESDFSVLFRFFIPQDDVKNGDRNGE